MKLLGVSIEIRLRFGGVLFESKYRLDMIAGLVSLDMGWRWKQRLTGNISLNLPKLKLKYIKRFMLVEVFQSNISNWEQFSTFWNKKTLTTKIPESYFLWIKFIIHTGSNKNSGYPSTTIHRVHQDKGRQSHWLINPYVRTDVIYFQAGGNTFFSWKNVSETRRKNKEALNCWFSLKILKRCQRK